MTTSTLAIVILIATVLFFVISRQSRRPGKNSASMVLLNRLMAIFIFCLTIYYFFLRFVA